MSDRTSDQVPPDYKLAALAAYVGVLQQHFDVDDEEAIAIGVELFNAVSKALAEYGPELTLTAAEVLWSAE